MKKAIAYVCLLAAITMALTFTAPPALAQNNAFDAQFGATPWAQNNVRTASAYNWIIDASDGSHLNFVFPAKTCTDALTFGPGVTKNPFVAPLSTGLTVTITDAVAANNETVSFTSASFNGSICTLSLANNNTHVSYKLSSGTCGLQEAVNDVIAQGGGIVEYTQESVALGCPSATTITGLTKGLQANVSIHDISNGNNKWYNLQPSTLSALAVPVASANLTCATTAGLVCQSATTGGTWPNSAEHVGVIYVDSLGGWSVASVDHSMTPSASGTNVLQFNSPAASTGAVGWLPYGGLAYNSTTYVLPVDDVNVKCTHSTVFTGYPICAMGSTATVLGPVVTTSLIPQSGGIAAAYNPNPQSHTTFAYRPSQRPGYGFQLNYGPFTACPALTAGQLCVVGTVQLPTGFLQSLGIGGTIRFTFDVTNTLTTAGTATGVDVEIGDITDFTTGTPLIICTLLTPTSTGTANIKYHEQCDWTVNALGATGTIMPGGFLMASTASSGGTVLTGVSEQGTGAITADVLDQNSVYFVYLQTAGASTTTPPHMLDLKIEVLNN